MLSHFINQLELELKPTAITNISQTNHQTTEMS